MTFGSRLDRSPPEALFGPPDAIADLFLEPAQLTAHLRTSVAAADWLDAFLFAAGLGQLVDDHLHPDPLALRRAASFLQSGRTRAGTVGAGVATAAAKVLAAAPRARGSRTLQLWRPRLGALIDVLADLVVDPADTPVALARVDELLESASRVVAPLGQDVPRLPAAFRSFDQHPDDLARLAAVTRERHLTAALPACVLGVRTSGSYLAPLLAANLRAQGVGHVEVATYRPHRGLLSAEREQIQRIARAGGRVVVIDDPPGSGTSMALTAAAVERLGVRADAIVLVACTFAGQVGWPRLLQRWDCAVLGWSEWSVHHRMSDGEVARTLEGFLAGHATVDAMRRTGSGADTSRSHLQATYQAVLTDQDGRRHERDILVEGVGLGYLGRHALAVTGALAGWTPRVYGLAEGLLFSADAPPDVPTADAGTAMQIAHYCADRRAALPVGRDATTTMRGRDPAWEVAAAALSGMFGPAGPVARPLVLEPLTRRLLRVDEPCVVDGATDLRRWRVAAGGARLVKLLAHERAFSHLEGASNDAVFDLAGAAADAPTPDFEALLRRSFGDVTGTQPRLEPWLLHRLVQLWRMGRAGELDPATIARRSSLAVNQYLAQIYLADVEPAIGDLCAIDLDGVLVSDPLGYPATTPAGALALRAMIRHGYRPVPATGRSIQDARELCQVFGLPGAVAEYGAALYLLDTDAIVDLRSEAQRAFVSELRDRLAELPDVEVDRGHRYVIRARSGSGPLAASQLACSIGDRSDEITIVPGDGQTDIAVAGLDKASGLAALAARLDAVPRYALAVGDGVADRSMLAAATIGRAPANAARELRDAGVPIVRHRYQAGLLDATADLLGHRPGSCSRCRLPEVTPEARALLRVLELRENGVTGLAARTARLAVAVARAQR